MTESAIGTISAPLSGIVVLDIGLLIQGPQAGQILSDLGARVIKVEMPGVGEYSRWLPVSTFDRRSPIFIACNRGKQSVTIDLRSERGAELLLALAKIADVVISNFSPGAMEGWGLGYERFAERNPGIIYASASVQGPEAGTHPRGVDLTGQALSGLISINGPAGEHGYPVGIAIGDHLGAQNLAVGILAALLYRSRTGAGQRVTTSLLGSLLFAQGPEFMHFMFNQHDSHPAGNGSYLLRGLYGLYATSDGGVVITGVPDGSHGAFWAGVGLAEVMGGTSTKFLEGAERIRVVTLLREALGKHDTQFWCATFQRIGVDHAPVRGYEQVAADPLSYANGYLQVVDHPKWGKTVLPGNPVVMSESRVQPGTHTPDIGEHSAEILKEYLGLDDAEMTRLRSEGVI
jgi:CoA:oxalate CoA-transferase